ncbi:hypothetical protein [Vibrio gallaecicus]|uniref:hypothetical protein n=1 Tax=Vibrio gallaecicus TaxID=552386 RepID=UPI0025B2A856|nr:hypothetical protein [Vibrio gallaecicus]MDN3615600.1 hypothetical protein [Vibrio gallaecicus]
MDGDYNGNIVLISLTLSTFNNKTHNSCDEKVANRNKKATTKAAFEFDIVLDDELRRTK